MYNTVLNEASYSDKFNNELSRFVSANTAEMLTCYIESIEDTDFNLKFLFPEAYVDSHSRSECLRVVYGYRTFYLLEFNKKVLFGTNGKVDNLVSEHVAT